MLIERPFFLRIQRVIPGAGGHLYHAGQNLLAQVHPRQNCPAVVIDFHHAAFADIPCLRIARMHPQRLASLNFRRPADAAVVVLTVQAGARLAGEQMKRPARRLLLLALLAAVCLLCGAINGLLVLAAGLPPLLATLSTSVAFTGLTDLLTGQRRIAVSDPLMVAFRDNSVLGLPWPLVYLLGVFILFQFLLHHSRFGQHVQAVGGNRDMAQMSGLNVRRLTLLVWLLAGIAAGLAILPLLSQGSGSSSGTATPLLLETVLATFIGAAFSRRRVVTIWGALLGAILVNALSNGLGLLGVNIFWMGAIKGGLILVVLAASAVRHKGGEA